LKVVAPLGFRAAAVDAVLTPPQGDAGATRGAAGPGSRIVLSDPEPWASAVDGAELLDELAEAFTHFLALPQHGDSLLALWTTHAHAHGAALVSPLLALTSPVKRCGKTTALTLLGALVPKPLPAANVTASTLFRAVEQFHPTLLVDEADTFLTSRDELRGVLSSGHHRPGAVVVRTVGDNHEVRTFSTWCPKVVAMIGELPDTLADRSHVLQMRRRGRHEVVDKLRLDRLDELEPLKRRAQRWARDNLDALGRSDPVVPEELNDRAADNWRPLFAIADRAGGAWPEKARAAAKALVGADDGRAADVRVHLLADIRSVFDARDSDRIASTELATALASMEDRSWAEWGRARKPITPTGMARLLSPFNVKPGQMKVGGEKVRGYVQADFSDAFAHYLAPAGDSETVLPVPPNDDAPSRGTGEAVPPGSGTGSEDAENPRGNPKVPGVPLRPGGATHEGTPGPSLDLWTENAGAATQAHDERRGLEL
jgi:putative DNA primase/helicase